MGRSIFFEKSLRIQFDNTFDSESNDGIFDSLAPFDGELWRFENFKFVRHLQPTQNFFLEDFFVSIGRVKIAITHHQTARESRKYHDSTQNQKFYRTVSLDFFRKKLTFPLCFYFNTLISKIFGYRFFKFLSKHLPIF